MHATAERLENMLLGHDLYCRLPRRLDLAHMMTCYMYMPACARD